MDKKPNLNRSFPKWFFGHKPAEQANTQHASQAQPESASPLSENVPIKEQKAPIVSAILQKQLMSSPRSPLEQIPEGVPAVWKVGDLILGEYEVRSKLGEGGMGTVYKIHYRRQNINIAVKSPRSEIFARADGKENFIREAETWMHLRENPYLVSCHFVRTLGGIPRIFAEYVDGGSLADWIRQRKLYEGGPECALERMLDVAIQFAWGLYAAHEQGLVHQDVKPANVMLTSQGIAKVTDFGLAKARAMAGEGMLPRQEGKQSLLVSWGGMTPAYCSPEQAAKQALSHKTDIWSWGLAVLEMFTGEVTWTFGIAAQEVLASHERQDPAIPVMPVEVVKLLNRCFQQQPEKRPVTMLEVATELQAIYTRLVERPYSREAPKPAKLQASTFNKQGTLHQDMGKMEEALVAYEQAIGLDPTFALAYYNKGNVLKQLGRLEEALVADEQAIGLDPTYFDAYNNKGNVLKRLGRPKEALVAYEQAIYLAPTLPYVHHNKALVLEQLGRPEEALVAYEQAISLDPRDAKAHYYKGNTLQGLGQLKEALVAYEQVIRLDPTFALAYYCKGVMLKQLGRPEEALLAYEQAIGLNPTYVEAYTNKGLVLQDLRRTEEALKTYEQAIGLNPTYVEPHNNKGNALFQLGRLKEALLAFEQATCVNPTFAPPYNNKGLVLRDLGRLEEALLAFEQAIRLDPTSGYTHCNKGSVLLQLRRREEALLAFEQAIRLDPSLAFAIAKALGI